MDDDLINLYNGGMFAQLHKGELVRLDKNNFPYFHGGGKPQYLKNKFSDFTGWEHSEITMFPIIGPVDDFCMTFKDTLKTSIDQHGISRLLPFELIEQTKGGAVFKQSYEAFTLLQNPKYKEGNGHPEFISWPFSCTLEKEYTLLESGIITKLTPTNTTLKNPSGDMHYQIGWHPAGKSLGSLKEETFDVDQTYTLEDVVEESKRGALIIDDHNHVVYTNIVKRKSFEFITEGFNHIMLWSPSRDARMFCIEPITHLPNKKVTCLNDSNSDKLGPGESKEYSVQINIL